MPNDALNIDGTLFLRLFTHVHQYICIYITYDYIKKRINRNARKKVWSDRLIYLLTACGQPLLVHGKEVGLTLSSAAKIRWRAEAVNTGEKNMNGQNTVRGDA